MYDKIPPSECSVCLELRNESLDGKLYSKWKNEKSQDIPEDVRRLLDAGEASRSKFGEIGEVDIFHRIRLGILFFTAFLTFWGTEQPNPYVILMTLSVMVACEYAYYFFRTEKARSEFDDENRKYVISLDEELSRIHKEHGWKEY